MTAAQIIAEVKLDLWFINFDYPQSFWDNKLDNALKKFTINSGKTKWLGINSGSQIITFTANHKIYKPVHVYAKQDGALGNEVFDIFGQNFYYNALYDSSVQGKPGLQDATDLEFVMLKRSYIEQLKTAWGNTMDFYWDNDELKLYINDKISFSSLILEYLPVWGLIDEYDEIMEIDVIEWIKDCMILMIKDDFNTILESGAAFELPTGAAAFATAAQDLKDLESSLRKRFPLLGMSRR